MNEQPTRFFTLDSDMESSSIDINTLEYSSSNAITFPLHEKDCFISPRTSPVFSLLPSIDARFQKLLKPVIGDISVLKPKKFYALAADTYHALSKEAKTAHTSEAQESIDELLSLLGENMELIRRCMNYMNSVRKI